MTVKKEHNLMVFPLLFLVLILLAAGAGKVIVDLKTLEREAVYAEKNWAFLYQSSIDLFSFSAFQTRPERETDMGQVRAHVAGELARLKVLQDQFEASLGLFRETPYQILFDASTKRYIHGAGEAWRLTRQKLHDSQKLFEKIIASAVGERLLTYSYKELVEEAVSRDNGKGRIFLRKDLFLFYRLQDNIVELAVSRDVFENVLKRISRETSQRMMMLIVVISLFVFLSAVFIFRRVIVMGREIQGLQRRYRAIFDQTLQLTGLMTPEGVLLEANQTSLDFVGVTLDQVLKKPFWETAWWAHSQETRDQVCDAVRRAARGESVREEASISMKGGMVGYIDFSIKPIKNDRGEVVLLIPEGCDITERRKADEILRQNEVRYWNMIELAVDGILMCSSQGRITGANSQMQKLLGRSPDKISGLHISELFDPQELKENPLRVDLLEKGETVVSERRLHRQDGGLLLVEMRSKKMPDGTYQSFIRDITERKAVEKELKEHREHLEALVQERAGELGLINDRLKAEIEQHKMTEAALENARNYLDKIINSIADPIFVKDREHRWILMNDVMCHFFGRSREELLGRSDYEFFPKAEADIFWDKDEEVFNTGRENINEEFFTDGTGKTRTIVTKKTLYVDNSGNKILVGIIRDITQMRQQAQELKETYEQMVALQGRMVQAEKMASLGQLAAGVAHEINNPTAYILCNLDILRDYEKNISEFLKRVIALSPDLERHEQLMGKFNITKILDDVPLLIDETSRGADRIKKIVQDLRVFAHPDVGGFEYSDLHQCIDGALAIMGGDLKKKVELVKDYGQLPLVRFKEQQILQVFINLLSNALQAIGEKGKITIRTRVEKEEILVEVTDTGGGIPEENIPRIFDPFFTTKPVGQGTGLGLSVVHGILEQHQGAISVQSKVNEGTTFVIRLLKDGPGKKAV